MVVDGCPISAFPLGRTHISVMRGLRDPSHAFLVSYTQDSHLIVRQPVWSGYGMNDGQWSNVMIQMSEVCKENWVCECVEELEKELNGLVVVE